MTSYFNSPNHGPISESELNIPKDVQRTNICLSVCLSVYLFGAKQILVGEIIHHAEEK